MTPLGTSFPGNENHTDGENGMGEWRPIETAPRNKAIIAIANGKVGEACWIDYGDALSGWYWADDRDPMDHKPEHWMPLPEPPKG